MSRGGFNASTTCWKGNSWYWNASKRRLPHPPQGLAKTRIARQVSPHHEHVDQKANEAFRFLADSPSDGRADGKIFLPV